MRNTYSLTVAGAAQAWHDLAVMRTCFPFNRGEEIARGTWQGAVVRSVVRRANWGKSEAKRS